MRVLYTGDQFCKRTFLSFKYALICFASIFAMSFEIFSFMALKVLTVSKSFSFVSVLVFKIVFLNIHDLIFLITPIMAKINFRLKLTMGINP